MNKMGVNSFNIPNIDGIFNQFRRYESGFL